MKTHRKFSLRHVLVVFILVAAGLCFLAISSALLIVTITPVPDISSFSSRQINQSTRIYDRTGQILLYDYNRDARRELVTIADISPNVINATLAIEDSSFYDHAGIRLTSISRAAIMGIISGSITQGGSTITQQLVKNTLLTGRRSVVRKLHEWVLAIKLEQTYSKDQILEAYLNSVSYGGILYGVEAAAQAYFGKTAKDVTVAEAAYLAAMLRAPSFYSPTGPNRDKLSARKDLVLGRMNDLGFIDNTTYEQARVEKVYFSPATRTAIIAPHFVFYILSLLEARYGQSALFSGLKVTTTLDVELALKAESIVNKYALENERKFRASNASLVAIDPSNGQILAMVGSRNFFDKDIDGQYNATLALRQPGSAMKPLIYAHALLNGFTRNTVIFDVPTQFSTACDPSDIYNNNPPCYAPKNYDNKFRGPMTFETALAQSVNIPAIKVLYLVGIQNAINLARSFGITSLDDPNRYGLTLVLGGGEVRLLDLVGAYSVFANDGIKNTPTGILEVADFEGNILEQYSPNPSVVLPKNIARDVSAMLSSAQARFPSYSLDSPLSFRGYDVAVKTGTTDDTRDAWVVGFTPSIALGVWTGNNDNSPMITSIAGFIAAPMWHEVMAYAISKYPETYFGEPSPIYSFVPPMLQGNWCIPNTNGNVVPRSLLYWIDKNNPQGPPPSNPSQDPQFAHWEYGVSALHASRPDLFSSCTMPPVPLTTAPPEIQQPAIIENI